MSGGGQPATPEKPDTKTAAPFSPNDQTLSLKRGKKQNDCGYVYFWRLPATVTVTNKQWLARWLVQFQDNLRIAKVGIAGESQHSDEMRFVKLIDRLHEVNDTFTGGRADVPCQDMTNIIQAVKKTHEVKGPIKDAAVCNAVVEKVDSQIKSLEEIAKQMQKNGKFRDLSLAVYRDESYEDRCLLHGTERLLRSLLGVPINDYVAMEIAAKPQKATKDAKDKTKVSGKDELIVTTDAVLEKLRNAFVDAKGGPTLRGLLAAMPKHSLLIDDVEVKIDAPWFVDAKGQQSARTAIVAVRVFADAADKLPSPNSATAATVKSSDAKSDKPGAGGGAVDAAAATVSATATATAAAAAKPTVADLSAALTTTNGSAGGTAAATTSSAAK